MARVKHVPQRTCIACREVQGKRSLLRLVRTPAGEIVLDPTGKKSGRGAYVHAMAACVEAVLKGQRLQHALKVAPTPENLERLRCDLEHAVARADLLARLPAQRGARAEPDPERRAGPSGTRAPRGSRGSGGAGRKRGSVP